MARGRRKAQRTTATPILSTAVSQPLRTSLPSYDTLAALSAQKVNEWFRAATTQELYKRYVREAKTWLEDWTSGMTNSDVDALEVQLATDQIAFKYAFDTMSEYTAKALHAFVIYKCNVQGLSYKTAEGIRSAFKNYFT